MGLATHQSKRGYAISRRAKERLNFQLSERAKRTEEEVQRRVALELWKIARAEEEAS
jgi:hypothetical protein